MQRIMAISLLGKENTGLVIVDVQEKLMGVMGQRERVVDRVLKLLDLARVFQLPVILTEQNPQFLGATLPVIQESLPGYESIEKVHFDCCEVDAFNDVIEKKGLRNIILTGVETHICVFQTCVSLLDRGYQVHVPHHAVDSRRQPADRPLPHAGSRRHHHLHRDHHLSNPQKGRHSRI